MQTIFCNKRTKYTTKKHQTKLFQLHNTQKITVGMVRGGKKKKYNKIKKKKF